MHEYRIPVIAQDRGRSPGSRVNNNGVAICPRLDTRNSTLFVFASWSGSVPRPTRVIELDTNGKGLGLG